MWGLPSLRVSTPDFRFLGDHLRPSDRSLHQHHRNHALGDRRHQQFVDHRCHFVEQIVTKTSWIL